MENNKGVTLVELIVVMALIFLVLPFAWDYINSSVQDNVTLNNKMAVQGSVNALMTQLQRDIQEARYPINPLLDSSDNSVYRDVNKEGFLICKPGDTSVIYTFDEDEKKVYVKNNLKLNRNDFILDSIDDTDAETLEYQYIDTFSLTLKEDGNGVEVYIRGKIDEKSGYTLTNTYYTRNTIF